MAGEIAATSSEPAQSQAAQGASTSPGSTAPAPGTAQTPSQTGKPLSSPLVKDHEFLEKWRQRHGFKPSAAPASPAASAAEPSKTDTATTPAVEPARTAAPALEPPHDDLAARVAKFSREEREFSARQAAFKAEQAAAKAEREQVGKQHEEKLRQAETVEKAAKALESGDVIGAIRMLKGDVNPSALALTMLEQLNREDERQMSPAEVERMIADRLESERVAREKAAEESRKAEEDKRKTADAATLESAREQYVASCHASFDKAKHPFIAAHGLPSTAIIEYVEGNRDEKGRMLAPPLANELLDHFEGLYRKRAEAAGWAPRVEPTKPVPSPSFSQSSMAQDQGSRLTAPAPRTTLEEQRAEMKRLARMGGRQT